MPNRTNRQHWIPPSPQSLNGWGQAVSGQIMALLRQVDHLYDWELNRIYHQLGRIEDDMHAIRVQLATTKTEPKSSLMSVIKDFLVANAWQIGLAIFALGAAVGKTGKFPDPVGLLLGAIRGMIGQP
jgi:hypothetical protein